MSKYKIINDPVHGFISIPDEKILALIDHPFFQRLRRISQMGLSFLVYPGATHTRFHHSIGAMHLMQTAVNVLKFKGVDITQEEETAVLAAILLHDIGHGPFSHALEYSIIDNISHEEISLALMRQLNSEFDGFLDLGIAIFKGKYPKRFLTELISSQMDTDRLDYLRRDSFYSGVIEGQVNSGRLIKMMNVRDNRLVTEEKGIYSLEKFIISRRLMYWQVYYHKTVLLLEIILTKVLQRVKDLLVQGISVPLDEHLAFLFREDLDLNNPGHLDIYTRLDDSDILYHVKQWAGHKDFILSYLSNMIVNRRHINKMLLRNEAFGDEEIAFQKEKAARKFGLTDEETDYLVFSGTVSNLAYDKEKPLLLLKKNGEVEEFSKATDRANIEALSLPVVKYYLGYPRYT